jgi:gentisate 1,2-dioxygenase
LGGSARFEKVADLSQQLHFLGWRSRCKPAIWHFDDVKALVMESGSLITVSLDGTLCNPIRRRLTRT